MNNDIFSPEFTEKLQQILYTALKTAPMTAAQLATALGFDGSPASVNLVQVAIRTLLPEVQSSRRWGYYLSTTPKKNTGAGRKRSTVEVSEEFVNNLRTTLSERSTPIAISRLSYSMGLDPVVGPKMIRAAIKQGFVTVASTKGANGGIRLVNDDTSSETRAA